MLEGGTGAQIAQNQISVRIGFKIQTHPLYIYICMYVCIIIIMIIIMSYIHICLT